VTRVGRRKWCQGGVGAWGSIIAVASGSAAVTDLLGHGRPGVGPSMMQNSGPAGSSARAFSYPKLLRAPLVHADLAAVPALAVAWCRIRIAATVASATRDPDAASTALADATAAAVASPRNRRERDQRTNLSGLSLRLRCDGGGEIGPNLAAFLARDGFRVATTRRRSSVASAVSPLSPPAVWMAPSDAGSERHDCGLEPGRLCAALLVCPVLIG
jgi:hypothetical protein